MNEIYSLYLHPHGLRSVGKEEAFPVRLNNLYFHFYSQEKKRDNVRTRRGLESSSRLLRAPKQSSGRRQLSANFSFS